MKGFSTCQRTQRSTTINTIFIAFATFILGILIGLLIASRIGSDASRGTSYVSDNFNLTAYESRQTSIEPQYQDIKQQIADSVEHGRTQCLLLGVDGLYSEVIDKLISEGYEILLKENSNLIYISWFLSDGTTETGGIYYIE